MPGFLDANILLRYLRNDDPIKSLACKALFERIEHGAEEAWTSDLVISEVVFVLSNPRTYNVPRSTIAITLLRLLRLPNLRVYQKRIYPRVFELYTTLPISYADCYNAAFMEARKQIDLYSYDTDFDDIPSISRKEPL